MSTAHLPRTPALPVGSRLLHVGPPKTGTTAVQRSMHQRREALAEHRVHYAGSGPRPRDATLELRWSPGSRRGAWDALVAEVAGSDADRVCVSSESLSLLTPPQAVEAVTGLGGEDVHVVLTVRPIDALLPSMWQQRVRRLVGTSSYEDWLRAVLTGTPDDEDHAQFWQLHDLAAQLDAWSGAAAPERVVAIVAEEGNHSFLPDTFEDLLGLPRGLLAPTEETTNPSLTRSAAELVLELDRLAHEQGWDVQRYVATVRRDVVNYLRSPDQGMREPKVLPAWAEEPVRELNEARAALLAETAARVIGDHRSLASEGRPITFGEVPARPHLSLSLAAGVAATAARSTDRALAAEVRRTTRRIERLEAEVEAASASARARGRRLRARAGRAARAVLRTARGGRRSREQ
ncbi:hypothetical protein [Nocardioides pantholopis]|uniref:hypothetical protein n=1 Tax=Nocardioides pantholopis TaxID=2483798 RepID=UPI0013E3EB9A|nr:hypothetical protein [Nocardioides pantholopis]